MALLIGYRPDPTVLAAIAVLNLAQAMVMVASALIISSHTTSVRAANLLAAFIILPMSVIIQGNNLLILWGGATQLWLIGAALSLFAVLLIRMGLQLFNREQILAREMDDLRPRRFVSLFQQLWRLPPHDALGLRGSAPHDAAGRDGTAPFSVRRLYLHDIPSLLRLRWPALGVVVLGLGGAAVLGWVVATHYPIDLNAALTPGSTGRGLLGGVTGGAVDIPAELLVTLVRALLVGGLLILLAVMSFGTLPVLLMMLVAGVGGFVLGQMGAAGASPLALGATLVLPPVLFPAVAFVLLTAFAVRFGLAVAAPPPGFGLGESLLLALVEYLKIGALALPLLLVGGLLQTVLLVVVRAFGY